MRSSKNKSTKKTDPKYDSKNPAHERWKIILKFFHIALNNGWIQNVVSSFVIVPLLIWATSHFMGRHAVLILVGIVVTVLTWYGIWHFWNKPQQVAKAIENKPIVPYKAPTPLTMSPSDIISQAVAEKQMSQVSTTGSGGIQPWLVSTYENQYVEWTLYLRSVRQSYSGVGDGDLEVRCAENKDWSDSEASIILYTTASDHAFLGVSIDREQTFKVTGTIERVGTSEIWLQGGDIQPISATGL